MKTALSLLFVIALGAPAALADSPRIIRVTAEKAGMGWRFDVTLSHPDSGWDHYADGWEVIAANGKVLGQRALMHPHVKEQPFTRSLVNVMVPDGMREVFVRARCSQAGWASDTVTVHLRP
ncbi:hypothetical protein [Thalassovita taeanensis]|uniref:Secreted protein n=1 Tax=Thalassovita taeanensis TaxID=657014 RepID=A0A1H9IH28_9RHOB|nr:hypothetical protein [Thalassovita taeanensis]SEQ73866.1 hypothetical protein SAMN04488092_11231 [Thalassovita taeanensis]